MSLMFETFITSYTSTKSQNYVYKKNKGLLGKLKSYLRSASAGNKREYVYKSRYINIYIYI